MLSSRINPCLQREDFNSSEQIVSSEKGCMFLWETGNSFEISFSYFFKNLLKELSVFFFYFFFGFFFGNFCGNFFETSSISFEVLLLFFCVPPAVLRLTANLLCILSLVLPFVIVRRFCWKCIYIFLRQFLLNFFCYFLFFLVFFVFLGTLGNY